MPRIAPPAGFPKWSLNCKCGFCVDEFQRVHPVTLDLFGRLSAEGQLREQGSDKIADSSQAILIFTSDSNAVEVERIQQEMTNESAGETKRLSPAPPPQDLIALSKNRR
jgi:hypothetical protein